MDSFWVKKNQVRKRKTTWEISDRNRWPRWQSSSSRTGSRLLPEMIKTHRILQSGLYYNSKFSLGPHKSISAPNQQEVAWNTTPTFPTNGLWVFFFLEGNGVGELSVFCQSYFNKTLIGQAGSIGGKARQEVGWSKETGSILEAEALSQPLLHRPPKRQHVSCHTEKGTEPMWLK